MSWISLDTNTGAKTDCQYYYSMKILNSKFVSFLRTSLNENGEGASKLNAAPPDENTPNPAMKQCNVTASIIPLGTLEGR